MMGGKPGAPDDGAADHWYRRLLGSSRGQHPAAGQRVLIAAIMGCLVIMVAGCGGGKSTPQKTAAESVVKYADTAAASPSDAELVASPGADWSTMGGDLGNDRYSTLTQINKTTVSKLHLVWQESFGTPVTANDFDGGAAIEVEGTPLIYQGVMYVVDPQGDVVAANAATGKLMWRWRSNVLVSENLTEDTTAERGLAIGDGEVFVDTASGQLVAINAKNGQLNWSVPVALPGTKLESPAVPIYYGGVVYTGVSGAEVAEGHLDAYNALTGKRIWRTFVVCGTQQPPSEGQCPAGTTAASGGGGIWTYPTIDPASGLVYATTANPSSTYGTSGVPGDEKWTTSIVAMNMQSGVIDWGFQGVHHDLWDYDCLTPPVLFNHSVGTVASANGVEYTCKSDQHFELDQGTGTPLLPVTEKTVPTAAGGITPDVKAQKILGASSTQPIPAGNAHIVPECATPSLLPDPAPDGSKYVYSCMYAAPGSSRFIAGGINYSGGQDDDPLSYNPKLGYMNFCEMVSVFGRKLGSTKAGGSYLGTTTGWAGSVAAVTVKNNNLVWNHKFYAKNDSNCRGGTTASASNLVFTSSNKGNIYVLDQVTGKTLWSYKAPDMIAAAPVLYSVGGKEYMAIYVGGQSALLGGETTPHEARMMVFSVDAPATSTTNKLVIAPGALHTTGLSNTPPPKAGSIASGESIFTANCGGCHTLAAAGTHGESGPNLDQLDPTEQTVQRQVTNGGGGMPAFGKDKTLSTAQVKAVAKYVYAATHTH